MSLRIHGYEDEDTGVKDVHFDIYRMTRAASGLLGLAQTPLDTVYLDTRHGPGYVDYNLELPGLYSVVARVRDSVNNTAYGTALLVYDPSSSITTSSAIIVTGARRFEEDYWLPEVDTLTGTSVEIKWQGRYRNTFYANNDVLEEVEPFLDGMDDNTGNRTVAAVPNVEGIVQYEFALENVTHRRRRERRNTADLQWETVLPIEERVSVPLARLDGQAFMFHLKARDLGDHEAVDVVWIRVDSTPPVLEKIEFFQNTGFENKEFYSRYVQQSSLPYLEQVTD